MKRTRFALRLCYALGVGCLSGEVRAISPEPLPPLPPPPPPQVLRLNQLFNYIVLPRFLSFVGLPSAMVDISLEPYAPENSAWNAFVAVGKNEIDYNANQLKNDFDQGEEIFDGRWSVTLIHELQHIYRNYFLHLAGLENPEEAWLAEGTSRLYEALLSGQAPSLEMSQLALRSGTPPLLEGFLDGEGISESYGNAFLFVTWAYAHYGDSATLRTWLRSRQRGEAAFLEGLNTHLSFESLYSTFALALTLNSAGIPGHPEWELGSSHLPLSLKYRMAKQIFAPNDAQGSFNAALGSFQSLVRNVPYATGCFDVSKSEASIELRLIHRSSASLRIDRIGAGFCLDKSQYFETSLVVNSLRHAGTVRITPAAREIFDNN